MFGCCVINRGSCRLFSISKHTRTHVPSNVHAKQRYMAVRAPEEEIRTEKRGNRNFYCNDVKTISWIQGLAEDFRISVALTVYARNFS